MKRILAILLAALCVFSFLWSCTGKEEEAPVVKVQSITIEQSDMTLTEGESVNLSAKVLPDNAADKTVNWSSSNESVVLVSSNGKAMALSLGKAIITAKSGDKSDFITISVEAKVIPVTGVSLDKTQITIKVGESETLTPTITPEDATNKKVSWTSSNDKVATVEDGKVVGVQPGSVTITVTTEDGAKTAECPVTVKSSLAPSVTVGAEHISAVSAILSGEANLETTTASDLKVGFQYSKSAGILPSNSTTIEATDADADYNYTTPITGLDPDTKYYFRSFVRQNGQDTYGETKEFTTKELSSMLHTKGATSISAVSACLNAGLDLTDVQYENKSLGFYWGSSPEALNSKVTAKEGSSSISADISELAPSKDYYFRAFFVLDGKEYTEEVLSFKTKDIESILGTFDATDIEATKASLNAKLDLTDVKYSSKNYGFYWGTSENFLNNRLGGGEINDNAYSAPLTGLSHKTQYWYEAYVKLDSQTIFGEVKTFTTGVVPVESVSLDKTEYTFNTIGSTLPLKATVLPADATDKSIEWSSDNEEAATVDQNGTVKAIGDGTATIKAEAKDGSGFFDVCFITVTVDKKFFTDVLNASFTGALGNQYIDWSGKKGSGSAAVYAGNNASQYGAIQLRSKNNNCGIVSTTSGGILSKVGLKWNSQSGEVGNTGPRVVQIYGSNTAYTSPSDLYDSGKQGTKIGELTYGQATELSVSGNYSYVGLRSKEYALFLDEIIITWTNKHDGEGGDPQLLGPLTLQSGWKATYSGDYRIDVSGVTDAHFMFDLYSEPIADAELEDALIYMVSYNLSQYGYVYDGPADYDEWGSIEAGTYYVYIVGLDDNNNLTGNYAFNTISVGSRGAISGGGEDMQSAHRKLRHNLVRHPKLQYRKKIVK